MSGHVHLLDEVGQLLEKDRTVWVAWETDPRSSGAKWWVTRSEMKALWRQYTTHTSGSPSPELRRSPLTGGRHQLTLPRWTLLWPELCKSPLISTQNNYDRDWPRLVIKWKTSPISHCSPHSLTHPPPPSPPPPHPGQNLRAMHRAKAPSCCRTRNHWCFRWVITLSESINAISVAVYRASASSPRPSSLPHPSLWLRSMFWNCRDSHHQRNSPTHPQATKRQLQDTLTYSCLQW